MTRTPAGLLRKIRTLDLSDWQISFWLVKRRVVQRDASYSVLRVDIDARLKKRFKSYFKNQLQSRDFHLDEYDFSNADGDDVLLTMEADATDFPNVAAEIAQGFSNHRAKAYDDLLNSWAYVVLFEQGNDQIYAWRKINAMTQPKKVRSRKALLFHNQQLMDIEEDEVFLIDPHFDFYVHNGMTFIANKREFESSMNFRQGMMNHGAELLSELEDLNLFDDVNAIQQYVGDNLHHLRKLAAIRKARYYADPDYLKRLISVSRKEGWPLKVSNGKIVVEPESIDLLLKLLNNDRLRSPINQELFDSAAKRRVAGA